MVLRFLTKPGGHVKFIASVVVVGELVVAGMAVVLAKELVVLLVMVQMYEPSVL